MRCAGLVVLALMWSSALGQERVEAPARAQVREVHFKGVQHVAAAELQQLAGELEIAPIDGSNWMHTVTERARAFWQARGYFRASVAGASAALPSSGDVVDYAVTLTVHEGAQYRLGRLTFGESSVFSPEQLRNFLPVSEGDIFASDKILGGIDAIRDAYRARGYIHLTLSPGFAFDDARHTVDLAVAWVEGKQFRMGKLEITGDAELAATLRSRFPLGTGEVYDEVRVEQFYKDNDMLLPGKREQYVSVAADEKAGTVDVRGDLSTGARGR